MQIDSVRQCVRVNVYVETAAGEERLDEIRSVTVVPDTVHISMRPLIVEAPHPTAAQLPCLETGKRGERPSQK